MFVMCWTESWGQMSFEHSHDPDKVAPLLIQKAALRYLRLTAPSSPTVPRKAEG